MNSRVYSDEILENMKDHIAKNSKRFITYPKFVFLCGSAFHSTEEYERSNRGIIEKFLTKGQEDIRIVLSEKLWEDSFNSSIDLLTFEDFLAEVSDCIVLFVESPGSYCELGAFAYANQLFSKKLIIVIDEKYKNDKSFILTGPTAKAKNNGAIVAFAPLENNALLSSAELRKAIEERVKDFSSKNAIINKRTSNDYENRITLNSFIIELLELIRIAQPIRRKDLLDLYKEIKGFSSFSFVKQNGQEFHNEIKFDYIIKLLKDVEIIRSDEKGIILVADNKTQSLMFTYSKREENRARNRLLCRKYRYKEITK